MMRPHMRQWCLRKKGLNLRSHSVQVVRSSSETQGCGPMAVACTCVPLPMEARSAEAAKVEPMESGRHMAEDSEEILAERMDVIADMRTEEKWRRSGDFKSKWRTCKRSK